MNVHKESYEICIDKKLERVRLEERKEPIGTIYLILKIDLSVYTGLIYTESLELN